MMWVKINEIFFDDVACLKKIDVGFNIWWWWWW
jgi:hypothetical protein